MTIGFDIDNTMIKNIEMCNMFYQNYPDKHPGNSYLEMPEMERRKFLDIYLPEIFKNSILMDNVKEVFDYLKSKNHRIIIITRRGHGEDFSVIEITKEYFKKKQLHYDEIYFKVTNKGEVCFKENVELFFDDHDFNLDSCHNYGIKSVKFGGEKHKKFDIVHDWYELLEYIKKEGF